MQQNLGTVNKRKGKETMTVLEQKFDMSFNFYMYAGAMKNIM